MPNSANYKIKKTVNQQVQEQLTNKLCAGIGCTKFLTALEDFFSNKLCTHCKLKIQKKIP